MNIQTRSATSTNMDSPTEIKIEKLIGKTNYLGWSKVIIAELKQKGYIKNESFDDSQKDKAVALILRSVSLKIAGMLPDNEGPDAMLQWLKVEYGSDDVQQIKRNLKNIKMHGIDLDTFWENFNMELANFREAGGSIDYSDQLDLVLENINAEFYLDTIRKIRFDLKSLDKEVNQAFFLKSKMALKDHYNATPESIRNRYKSSSLAQEGPSKGFAHSITPKKILYKTSRRTEAK